MTDTTSYTYYDTLLSELKKHGGARVSGELIGDDTARKLAEDLDQGCVFDIDTGMYVFTAGLNVSVSQDEQLKKKRRVIR